MKGNGMGPDNQGPATGRGLGFCHGWGKSGYLNDKVSGAKPRPEGRFGHDLRKEIHKDGELSD